VVTTGNNNVTRLDPSGTLIASHAVGLNPRSITVDISGNVFVSNFNDATVTKLSSTGVVLVTYTTGSGPSGMVDDASGNVWVANYNSNSVTRLSGAGTGRYHAYTGPVWP
jgi:streptogramin lyase